MENMIVEVVQKRLEELEKDCLVNAYFLKKYAPDVPIPTYHPDLLKEIPVFYECKQCEKRKRGIHPSPFMTVKEAASILKVSRNTIDRWRGKDMLTSLYRERNVIL